MSETNEQWADAEIDRLRVELAEAKARIAELEKDISEIAIEALRDHRELHARAERAEAELDISREAHRMMQSALLSQAAETERAEAELKAMRELLDWIYGFLAYVDSYHSRMIRYKVRAALAPSPAEREG